MQAIDIETTGLHFKRDKIIGIGVGDRFILGSSTVFCPPTQAAYHNGKFDIKFLQEAYPTPIPYTFDTMLAASCLIHRPESLTLDSLAAFYLKEPNWKSLDRKNMSKYSPEEVAEYCLKDVSITSRLQEELLIHLKNEKMEPFFTYKLMPAARLMLAVEQRGIGFDVAAAKEELNKTSLHLQNKRAALDALYGTNINWSSWQQIKKAIPQLPSTSSEVLEEFKELPGVRELLEYKTALKRKGYLQAWLENQVGGRIYPTYNLASTRTGRLSCSEPNLQQVPRDKGIRSLFIPAPGKVFIIADYAQIEPRVVAHYSRDRRLLETFISETDFYGTLAVELFGTGTDPNEVAKRYPELRQVAKVVGLSLLYGIGITKLIKFIKQKAGISLTLKQGGEIKRNYFSKFKGLEKLRKSILSAIEKQHTLENYYGRQFKISPERAFSTGVNTLIQSTASDACLFSQLKFANDPRAQLVAIIHDEIIYEAHPETAEAFAKDLEEEMTNQGFCCPLRLEYKIGKSWSDK